MPTSIGHNFYVQFVFCADGRACAFRYLTLYHQPSKCRERLNKCKTKKMSNPVIILFKITVSLPRYILLYKYLSIYSLLSDLKVRTFTKINRLSGSGWLVCGWLHGRARFVSPHHHHSRVSYGYGLTGRRQRSLRDTTLGKTTKNKIKSK